MFCNVHHFALPAAARYISSFSTSTPAVVTVFFVIIIAVMWELSEAAIVFP